MENSKNYIDNLYSNTFGEFEDTPPNEEWNALSAKLGRVNFLKFSFSSFNVYYLFVILALTGSTVYLGVNTYKLSTKNELLEKQIEKINHSITNSNVSVEIKKQKLPDANTKSEKTSTENVKKIKKNVETDSASKHFETNRNTSTLKSVKESTNIPESNINKSETTEQNATKTITEASTADSSMVKKTPAKIIKKVHKTVIVKPSVVVVKDTIINNK